MLQKENSKFLLTRKTDSNLYHETKIYFEKLLKRVFEWTYKP